MVLFLSLQSDTHTCYITSRLFHLVCYIMKSPLYFLFSWGLFSTLLAQTPLQTQELKDAHLLNKLQDKLAAHFAPSHDQKASLTLANSHIDPLTLLQWQVLFYAKKNQSELITRREEAQGKLAKAKLALPEASVPVPNVAVIQKIQDAIDRSTRQMAIPTHLQELLADKAAAASFELVCSSQEMLEGLFYSSEVPPVLPAIYIFSRILEKDASLAQASRERDIAWAIAIEYAMVNGDPDLAVERALFFIKNFRAGKLHTVFNDIPLSLMRVIVTSKNHKDSVSLSSMQWYIDNAHMPQKYYVGFKGQSAICWRCGWHLNNLLGDSIHVNYYETYDHYFGDNHATRTSQVGGVCGSISSFGAACAVANGIPATTMGEPGHCAYAVLVNGTWTPSYSLSWKRNIHWKPWENITFFSALQLSYDMYTEEESQNTKEALELAALAMCLEQDIEQSVPAEALVQQADKKAQIRHIYTQALEKQNLAYPIYRAYFQHLQENPQQHDAVAAVKAMNQSLTHSYPEMAAYILGKHAMPALSMLNAAERRELLCDFWDNCVGCGIAKWDLQGTILAQNSWLLAAEDAKPKDSIAFFDHLLGTTLAKEEIAPAVLASLGAWSAQQKVDVQKEVTAMTLASIQKASATPQAEGAASMEVLLGKAILNAAKIYDLESFRSLSLMVDESQRHPEKMPRFKPFEGELLSEGGLISLSSSHEKHDSPHMHASVLDPRGGKLITDKATKNNITVLLPRVVEVKGIIIVNNGKRKEQERKILVQVSDTGTKDSWETVKSLDASEALNVRRIDLSEQSPRARYIRLVYESADKESIQINGIYVYGKRSS